MKSDQIRLVFGMKLKRLRMAKGLSLAELSSRTGLSASYLNEIEKGRKYPKAERITPLAAALGTSYDKLVSLKLDKQLTPISDILNNELLQELPLDLFGIDRIKLMSVLGSAPAKAAAFIKTLSRIAAEYNVTEEHFYFAALRSHQELHENHFDETEEAVVRFRERFQLPEDRPLRSEQLRQLLQDEFACTVEERDLHGYPELSHMRSIHIPEQHKLLVNTRLAENQKAFLIAKELGFRSMEMGPHRPVLTPWPRATSFEHVLNNSKASYFAGALLIPAPPLLEGLRDFFASPTFRSDTLLSLLAHFNSSPEMFALRLTNLVPREFGIGKLFFQRFDHDSGTGDVVLHKELFLDRLHDTTAIQLLNDGVSGWLRSSLFPQLRKQTRGKGTTPPLCEAMRFTAPNGRSFFVMALGRRMGREQHRSLAVCIGVEVTPAHERTMAFLQDPGIGTTALLPRQEVVAERERFRQLQEAVDRLVQEELRKSAG